jgi:hypothetical protein
MQFPFGVKTPFCHDPQYRLCGPTLSTVCAEAGSITLESIRPRIAGMNKRMVRASLYRIDVVRGSNPRSR